MAEVTFYTDRDAVKQRLTKRINETKLEIADTNSQIEKLVAESEKKDPVTGKSIALYNPSRDMEILSLRAGLSEYERTLADAEFKLMLLETLTDRSQIQVKFECD